MLAFVVALSACRGDASLQFPESTLPTIDAAEPPIVSARGFAELVLRGSHLAGVKGVSFGDAEAEILSVDDDAIRVLTPRTVAGQPDVVVTLGGAEGAVRAPGLVEVTALELSFTPAAIAPYTVVEGGTARAAAAGDFDGDGDEDIVIAGDTPEVSALLLNNWGTLTDALIADPQRMVAPAAVRGIVAEDFDADGDLDLLFTTATDQPLQVLLNDGSARFVSGPELPENLAVATRGHAADFDGDGLPDLALVDRAEGEPSAHVLLNRTPAPGAELWFVPVDASMFAAAGTASTDVVPIDIDDDGDIDLMVVHASADDAEGRPYTVLRNDGTATLTVDLRSAVPFADGNATRGVALDCHADGDWDVFLAGNGQDHLLENEFWRLVDVTPRMVPVDDSPVGDVVARDLDLDGNTDLVIANVGAQNRIYTSRADGRMLDETPHLAIARDATIAVVVLDVDGDGADDLFFLNKTGPATFLLSTPEVEGPP